MAVVAVLMALVSCESRNPAAIWAERSARLGLAATREDLSTNGEAVEGLSTSGVDDAGMIEPDPDLESELRRVLSGGIDHASVARFGESSRRLDLALARRSGEVEVVINDPTLDPRLDLLFDGDTTSLARSEEINPLFLTFTFRAPVALKGVRLFPSYSSYDWGLQTGPDQDWLVIRGASQEAWSGIELEQSVETGFVKLELLRRESDDFVHLNEVEIWIEPAPL